MVSDIWSNPIDFKLFQVWVAKPYWAQLILDGEVTVVRCGQEAGVGDPGAEATPAIGVECGHGDSVAEDLQEVRVILVAILEFLGGGVGERYDQEPWRGRCP